MNNEPRNLVASAISGVGWNYLGGLASGLSSLAMGIVLARILGPKPYGQVIIASTIYGFLNLFVDGGFSQALIQRQALDERTIRTTFTYQVAIGASMTALVYWLAPWIARQFHDPSAEPVVRVMSLMIVLQALGLVSAALLRRRMRFKVIQCAALTSSLAGSLLVGIPLAVFGAGVWSLVAAGLCQCVLNAAVLYAEARHSLTPSFGLPDRAVAEFGGTIVANNLVNWGQANLVNLAASQLGPIALGLYGRACNFAYQPVNIAATGFQSVLMATAARTQEKQKQMRDLTLCAMAVVFGVLGSAYAVLALTPETVIAGFFGDKWSGVSPLMLPLAMAMPFYGMHCLVGPIMCGLGRPALEFWPQLISCAVGAAVFFAAGRYSVTAIAWALLGVMLLRFGLTASFAFSMLGISWAHAAGILINRGGFAVSFGTCAWMADQILRSPFHLAAGARLVFLLVFCSAGLGWTIWAAGELVFGRDALEFMADYSAYLPARYAARVCLQAGRQTTARAFAATSRRSSTGAAR